MAERIRAALAGCGTWGRNLLRVMSSHPELDLVAVVDPDPSVKVDGVTTVASLEAIASAVDAVVIAAPGPAHARIAVAAIELGAHVFIEKPMATSVRDALRVITAAERSGAIGMVGHLLRHHPAVCAMIDLIASGALGKPVAFRSERCSLPGARDPDGGVLWSLGPHDVSLLLAIDRSGPVSVTCETAMPGLAELAVTMGSGLQAAMRVSRASDAKIRTVRVDCERGAVEFDDCLASRKVRVFRGGEVEHLCYDAAQEPLRAEVDAFVRAIRTGVQPSTNLREGLAVVTLLDQAGGGRSVAGSARSMPPLEAGR